MDFLGFVQHTDVTVAVIPHRSIDPGEMEMAARVPGLDLARAVAILWVMWFHAQNFGLRPETDPVATYGWMGVDLFFVLSGFLIGGQIVKPASGAGDFSYRRFYLKRAFRILPAYLTIVLIYFAVPRAQEYAAVQPLWQFLTFTENLFIDTRHANAFSHVWSLCIEEHFYLLAPAIILLCLRWPSAWRAEAICGGIVLAGMALRAYVWGHDLAPLETEAGTDNDAFAQRWLQSVYYPTWARLDGLLFGVVLAVLKTFRPALWSRAMRRGNLLLAGGAIGMAISIAIFRDRDGFVASVAGYPVLSFSLALLVAAANSTASLIGRSAIPGAGPIAACSYSLYLSHKMALHAAASGLGHWPAAPAWVRGLAYVASVAAAGLALYWCIERPALRLRARFLRAG